MPPPPPSPPQLIVGEQNHVEEFLRKSLLGSELVDTQFYLFSTKSVSSSGSKVTRPRALCANNVLLANSSKYFSDLLNSTTTANTSLVYFMDDDQEIPSETHIDDYGYESDSDLEDEVPPPRVAQLDSSPPKDPREFEHDDEESWDRPVSVVSDLSILIPEQDQKSDLGELSGSNGKLTVQDSRQDMAFVQTTIPRSPSVRRVLVKGIAFQTWYALLYYLYTGKITFSPLKSAKKEWALPGPLEAPKCSAKSMYRLASKVGLEPLRKDALKFLRKNITERDILKELTSSLLRKYPPLLEMELDVLYSCIASEPVLTGFSNLAKRIAKNEVPHGADIIVGFHRRLLEKHHPGAFDCRVEKEVAKSPGKSKARLRY